MTAFLLDTNAVLFLAFKSSALSARDIDILRKGDLLVSQVCAIELATKQGLGKLALPPPFQTNFAHAFSETCREIGAGVLAIELSHVDTLSHLPLVHRDPFDRLMIAQALTENLTVVTRDHIFATYAGLNVLEI